MALDEFDHRYAKATWTVMFLLDYGHEHDVERAAYRAAMEHGLGLIQYGRLVRETKERYDD